MSDPKYILQQAEDRDYYRDQLMKSNEILVRERVEFEKLREALSAARADRAAYLEELTQLKDRLELERTFERAEAYDRLRAGGALELQKEKP